MTSNSNSFSHVTHSYESEWLNFVFLCVHVKTWNWLVWCCLFSLSCQKSLLNFISFCSIKTSNTTNCSFKYWQKSTLYLTSALFCLLFTLSKLNSSNLSSHSGKIPSLISHCIGLSKILGHSEPNFILQISCS